MEIHEATLGIVHLFRPIFNMWEPRSHAESQLGWDQQLDLREPACGGSEPFAEFVSRLGFECEETVRDFDAARTSNSRYVSPSLQTRKSSLAFLIVAGVSLENADGQWNVPRYRGRNRRAVMTPQPGAHPDDHDHTTSKATERHEAP